MNKQGKLIGIGVGPGDPELLTIKALRTIKESDVIVVPGKVVTESVAYKIVKGIYQEIDSKRIIPVDMPMVKDERLLLESHDKAADMVEGYLNKGMQVAFLTLGDPTVYSTYIYVHYRIQSRGYETGIISGITSFCAVSARLNMGLVEKAEELHVIPASYQIEEALSMQGTKVLMKAGRKIQDVKRMLIEKKVQAMMIEDCGMATEKIYHSIEEIPDKCSYFSLIIIKDQQ